MTIMHTQTKCVILAINSRLLQASTKLADWRIRDSPLRKVKVASWPAAILSRQWSRRTAAETRS